ncbi:MAG: glycosyl hydrolase family 79 C-terminal domain-containing protein [Solirubrobacteraceae bacterium]
MLIVESSTTGRAIPKGFVGLSLELNSVEAYAGHDPSAVNPVLEQLIRNLAPAQRPVLRLGGDSTDRTWWPIPQVRHPHGVSYSLDRRWLDITRALTTALDARLILGINLQSGSRRVSRAEAYAMVRGIGRAWIEALELGNEPELYGGAALFSSPARTASPRRLRYDFSTYERDFSATARSMPRLALAGPSIGSLAWMPYASRFLRHERSVGLLTLHRYPLKRCGPRSNVTIGQLLSAASSRGLAETVAPYAAVAHARRIPLRIDEMNAVSCGGAQGVSDTFASALWSLDALFQMARVGVDGVNLHTRPGSLNELFTFRRVNGAWRAAVRPEYYALLLFASAAPPGSRLLRISGAQDSALQVWATRTADGHVRVVMINKDTRRARVLALRISGHDQSAALERLRAPGASSTNSVTLAGQSFGTETLTGLLAGTPHVTAVAADSGEYTVKVPAASAAMLTL